MLANSPGDKQETRRDVMQWITRVKLHEQQRDIMREELREITHGGMQDAERDNLRENRRD